MYETNVENHPHIIKEFIELITPCQKSSIHFLIPVVRTSFGLGSVLLTKNKNVSHQLPVKVSL
jgi:hypothetical protein